MNRTSLFQWVWKTLFKTIFIPILIMGLVYITLFFLTNEWTREQNIKLNQNDVNNLLLGQALSEADIIDKQLLSTAQITDVYRKQTENALQHPVSNEIDKSDHFQLSIQGDYYTYSDITSGGAVVYFPANKPITDEQLKMVLQLESLEGLMEDIQKTYPLVEDVYFNSSDSLDMNMIYTDHDLSKSNSLAKIQQYPLSVEVDALHDPKKEVKWTSTHIDPEGRGGMISAIAPVYEGEALKGTVGMDIRIETFVNKIINLAMPWKGFGVLVDDKGMILSMPPHAETLLGLNQFIKHDIEIRESDQGVLQDSLAGKDHVVAWSTLYDTGWKLILFTPIAAIAANANEISAKISTLGYWMMGILIIFYSILFALFYKRLKAMTQKIVTPLIHMKKMTLDIGNGNYIQPQPSYFIQELDETATQIVEMGNKLQQTLNQMEIIRTETEAAKNNLTSIVQSLDDVVFILNEDGIIVNIWANNESDLISSSQQIIGLPFTQFVEAHLSEEYLNILRDVFENGKPGQVEYRVETEIGWRWRLGRLAPIIDSDGIQRSVSVFSKDITESKEMESSLVKAKEEAELASKAKSEFLSSMSHELRTPMNAILGFAQLLEYGEDNGLDTEQKENVTEILMAGHHLLDLINDVLDLARIESGIISMDLESVPVLSLVEDCLGMFEPIAKDKEITLHHLVSEDMTGYEIQADPIRLKEILLNLLSNSVKYNKPYGSVSIHYERTEFQLKIHISDTGYGIAPDKLQKIFESFYRIKDNSVNVEGTGIGLPIAKQLIELMGGSIEVESKLDEGSRFSIVMSVYSGYRDEIVIKE